MFTICAFLFWNNIVISKGIGLYSHLCIHHQHYVDWRYDSLSSHSCPYCRGTFDGQTGLNIHIRTYHRHCDDMSCDCDENKILYIDWFWSRRSKVLMVYMMQKPYNNDEQLLFFINITININVEICFTDSFHLKFLTTLVAGWCL